MEKDMVIHGWWAKRENKDNKIRRDLIPIEQLKKVAERYTEWVTTHWARNREWWDLEFAEICKQSCFRHFFSYMNWETDENHFWAIVFNLFAYDFLIEKNNKWKK